MTYQDLRLPAYVVPSRCHFQCRALGFVWSFVGLGVNHLLVDWLMDGRRDDPADLVAVCVDLFAATRAQWDAAASSPGPSA
ncbi:hypothetical protein C8259_13105 [Nocardia nova]|jgi:hypothetical protein|uniref:Uncharacterized protein n=1 Tax=Nocardia nova TaxID=37330 RepID=A0A2T2Z743_9NOCA|nr:hypothetical protein C8259_13105 [Nocardia nova]